MDKKTKFPCSHGDICCDPTCPGSYTEEDLIKMQYQQNIIMQNAQFEAQGKGAQWQNFQGGYQPQWNHQYDPMMHPRHHRRFQHHKDFNHEGERFFDHRDHRGPFGGKPFHHHYGPPRHGPPPPYCEDFGGGRGRGMGRGCGRGRREWHNKHKQWQQSKQKKEQKQISSSESKQKQEKKFNKRFESGGKSSSSSRSFKSMSSNESRFQNKQHKHASLEVLQQLESEGFLNKNTNQALLIHFNNDAQKAKQCIQWSKSEKAKDMLLSQYRTNFSILEYLGYPQKIGYWKTMAILERSSNNLIVALKKLQTKMKNIEHNKMIQQKVQNCEFNYIEHIPQNPFVVIDVSNVVRANKHFKKLTKNEDLKQKLEAILRLKILVQTLAEGYFVLDKKLLDDAAEKEVTQKINVQIEGQRRMEVLYADENLKADDKIVEMIKKLSPQTQQRVLLVTSDRLLMKDCQDIIGKDMPVIGGKIFIKQCKCRLPKGKRNKVIKGLKSDRY